MRQELHSVTLGVRRDLSEEVTIGLTVRALAQKGGDFDTKYAECLQNALCNDMKQYCHS